MLAVGRGLAGSLQPAQAGEGDLGVEAVAAAMPDVGVRQPGFGDADGDGGGVVLVLETVGVETAPAAAVAEVEI